MSRDGKNLRTGLTSDARDSDAARLRAISTFRFKAAAAPDRPSAPPEKPVTAAVNAAAMKLPPQLQAQLLELAGTVTHLGVQLVQTVGVAVSLVPGLARLLPTTSAGAAERWPVRVEVNSARPMSVEVDLFTDPGARPFIADLTKTTGKVFRESGLRFEYRKDRLTLVAEPPDALTPGHYAAMVLDEEGGRAVGLVQITM